MTHVRLHFWLDNVLSGPHIHVPRWKVPYLNCTCHLPSWVKTRTTPWLMLQILIVQYCNNNRNNNKNIMCRWKKQKSSSPFQTTLAYFLLDQFNSLSLTCLLILLANNHRYASQITIYFMLVVGWVGGVN
jgi:hypothetical protein